MNRNSILATFFALLLVAGYGWVTIWGTHNTYNSPDANGYMAQAALLANTGTTELLPREDRKGRPFWGFFSAAWAPIDHLFSGGSEKEALESEAKDGKKVADGKQVTEEAKPKKKDQNELEDESLDRTAEARLGYLGMHWLENDRGEFWSRYPPGIGVLLAGPYLLFGPAVATWVQPLLAALTLFFLYLLCKPYLGPWGALLGAAIYALHPLAFVHALNWGSHIPVAFCLVTGFFFLDSWARRPQVWKVVIAAFLLGSMPSFRYAEVISGLAVGIFMIIQVHRGRAPWKHLIVAFVVACIPITLLLVRNYMAFGSPWDTGYALTGEQQAGTGFSLAFFSEKWHPFLLSLMGNGLGLFFALGLAGLVGMFTRKDTRPMALLLGLSIILITGAYTAYYWGGQNEMGLRFLLPTFPLYILPALWLFKEMATTRAARAGVGFLILAQMALFGSQAWRDGKNEVQKMERMAVAYDFLADNVPANSVLITDPRLGETLQFYPQWQLLDGSLIGGGRGGFGGFGRNQRGRGQQRTQGGPGQAPSRANPMQRGKARRLRARYDIRDSYERGRLIADDLYEIIAEGKPVYWVGSSRTIQGFEDKLVSGDKFESVAKIELPRPPRRRGARGRGGFGGFGGRGFNIGNRFGPQAGQKLELFKLVLADDKAESITKKKPTKNEPTNNPAKNPSGVQARPVEAALKKEK